MHASEDRPHALHPDNKHVNDKIRQQLQVLKDEGVVEFVGISSNPSFTAQKDEIKFVSIAKRGKTYI